MTIAIASRIGLDFHRSHSTSPTSSAIEGGMEHVSVSAIENALCGTQAGAHWNQLIRSTLLQWAHDPSQVTDDGSDAPNAAVIQKAINLARRWSESDTAPPDRIVPDPNGGIVFERKEGSTSEVIHIWDDGDIEYLRFDGTNLVERRPM